MRRYLSLAALAAWALPARPAPQLDPRQADAAAIALAGQVETARQQAIADGVRPVPAAVNRFLLGYFPATLLQKTRFASGHAEALMLPAPIRTCDKAVAVTLSEVVLFKTERLAQSDLRLWAHELTHVMQYQRWGVDGFADHCVRDSAAVEQEAVANAERFMTWLAGMKR